MKLYPLLGSLLFLLFICLGANVEIPLGPIPFILSDFFVLLAGLILGARYGGLTVGTYLLIGALGFPVFAGGMGGYAHLMGTSGGYLFGFLLAVVVSGSISSGVKLSIGKAVLATASGQICIFILGVSWLKFSAELTWGAAIAGGFTPFLIPILLKLVSVSALGYVIRNYVLLKISRSR